MADAFAQHGTWIRISLDAWDDDSYIKSRGAQPQSFLVCSTILKLLPIGIPSVYSE